MKKMRLDMDSLRVDSFTTVAAGGEKGTVRAYVSMLQCTSLCDTVRTCNPANSCANEFTCAITCSDGGSVRCDTNVQSCNQFSCVYTCKVNC